MPLIHQKKMQCNCGSYMRYTKHTGFIRALISKELVVEELVIGQMFSFLLEVFFFYSQQGIFVTIYNYLLRRFCFQS